MARMWGVEIAPGAADSVAVEPQERRHVEAGREHSGRSREHQRLGAFARRSLERPPQRGDQLGIERVGRRAVEAQLEDRAVANGVEHGRHRSSRPGTGDRRRIEDMRGHGDPESNRVAPHLLPRSATWKALRGCQTLWESVPGTSGPLNPPSARVHGQNNPFSFRVALATVGGGTLSCLTPHSGQVFDGHLEQHGEGFRPHLLRLPEPGGRAEPRPSSPPTGPGIDPGGPRGRRLRFRLLLFPRSARSGKRSWTWTGQSYLHRERLFAPSPDRMFARRCPTGAAGNLGRPRDLRPRLTSIAPIASEPAVR